MLNIAGSLHSSPCWKKDEQAVHFGLTQLLLVLHSQLEKMLPNDMKAVSQCGETTKKTEEPNQTMSPSTWRSMSQDQDFSCLVSVLTLELMWVLQIPILSLLEIIKGAEGQRKISWGQRQEQDPASQRDASCA